MNVYIVIVRFVAIEATVLDWPLVEQAELSPGSFFWRCVKQGVGGSSVHGALFRLSSYSNIQ